MAYLSQFDVEKLKTASGEFDKQFHGNLQYVPPPKWTCEELPTLLALCCPTNEVRPCDGTRLGLNGWDSWSQNVIESDAHDPNFSICTECSKEGMEHHLLHRSSPDGLSGE